MVTGDTPSKTVLNAHQLRNPGIPEEAGQLGGERERAMGTLNETGHNNPEPLLQRTANLASDAAVSGAARLKTLDSHGDERLDMLG